MSLNRREAERLAPKFEGYQIIGLSENSDRVALMNGNFEFFSYHFNEDLGEEVVASAISPIKSLSVVCGNEEDGLTADLDVIVKGLFEEVSEQKATISNLNAQIETLQKAVSEKDNSIHAHRLEMVKEAIKNAQSEIEEACDNADMSAEAEAMEARCEDYAAMENEGKFCGAERVRADMYQAFGEKQRKQLKEEKDKGAAKFAWNNAANSKNSDDGIAGLLNRLNRR